MDVTGELQHEAWQRKVMPPVEQLRPDLWSIPVPIPHNPLRYVSVYALAVPGGLGLIDTGWQSDEGWEALTAGLAGIGASITDVRGVVVTHMHFDHLGLAAAVREASGAWVAMHPADAALVNDWNDHGAAVRVADEIEFLIGLGADRDDAAADVGTPESMERFTRMARPDRLLEHGDLADFTGWQLRAVHTPGHTPGHLCFAEERTDLFFSGDHVLPRITPNISTTKDGLADPLRSFLGSLTALREHRPTEVLPAHEWRFTGLGERVDQLVEHHERRLTELLAAMRHHPASTPWELAAHLTWSRPWDQYERRMRIFAVTETDAHLRLLASRGLVRSDGGAVPRWTAVAR
ncbi:MAG: Beta-lactamase-like Metallo-hydrolase [Modestobacter sp.]|nr:Beta-lactamase-like Metallo-hydrolase [Modestobacter sp.]